MKSNKMNVVWEPFPGSQTKFMKCPVWECLLWGNRGGGKTDALLMDFLQGVGRGYKEDYKGLLLREATTELGDVVAKCKKWVPRIFPLAKYNGQRKIWTFPDGETLWLNYARTEEDYDQYHGHEYPWIGWEELTNHPFANVYLKLMSCNRSSNPNIHPKYRSTCNPSGPGHCVPFGEVLTPNGWVDIKEIKVSDEVYTVDQNKNLIISKVHQIHSEYYCGDMISVSKRGLNMVFTPKHKLPKMGGIVGDRNKEFTLLSFDDLPNETYVCRSVKWDGVELPDFEPKEYKLGRKSKLSQPKKITIEQYAELMGWFLSEGNVVDRDRAFVISQVKKRQRLRINQLLIECGFIQSWEKTGVTIYAANYWNYFRRFGKCRDKYIPKRLKQAKPEILKLLFNALMDGDGTWTIREQSGAYFTTSKKLAEDFEEIALKLGYLVHSYSRYRKKRIGKNYTINFKITKFGCSVLRTGNHRYSNGINFNSDCKRIPFDGTVYCLGIPDTHTFILKQKGTVWISGNSWVKKRFINAAPPGKIVHEKMIVEFPNEKGDMVKQEMTVSRTHVQSYQSENKALAKADPFYMAKIYDLTKNNEMLRKAWIEGSWDLLIGGFFSDVWDEKIHVIEPFKLPKTWRLDRSFDWGSKAPWAVVYACESNGEVPKGYKGPYLPKGSIIIPMEIYGWNGTPNEGDGALSKEIAERVLQVDNKLKIEYGLKCFPGPADLNIWEVRDGTSIAKSLSTYGCRWTRAYKGSGSRIAGWSIIRQLLGSAKRKDLESPHIYFFPQAENLIRTLPLMQRDRTKPEDIDTDLEDHLLDALRYRVAKKMNIMKRRKVGI